MTGSETMDAPRKAVPVGCAVLGVLVLTIFAPTAEAATFGELSNGSQAVPGTMSPYAAGPYSGAPATACPPDCMPSPTPIIGGPEGAYPAGPGATPYIPPANATPRAFLPIGNYADGPDTQLMLWSFGQLNSTTDPYNPWGLSTPYMYVPWSTPFAGWTNSATWNWWRERSGALPRNW